MIVEVEQESQKTGYIIITPDSGSPAADASVTFGLINGGNVQYQAGSPPGPAGLATSVPLDISSPADSNLGMAIVNTGSEMINLVLALRDEQGNPVGQPSTLPVGPYQHVSFFVSEFFANSIGPAFAGSLTLQSDKPFAGTAIHYNEKTFSWVPLSLIGPASGISQRTLQTGSPLQSPNTVGGENALIFPQFVMGNGWATQISLINTSHTSASGRMDIFDANGLPLTVTLNGVSNSTFSYFMLPNGVFIFAPRDSSGRSPF